VTWFGLHHLPFPRWRHTPLCHVLPPPARAPACIHSNRRVAVGRRLWVDGRKTGPLDDPTHTTPRRAAVVDNGPFFRTFERIWCRRTFFLRHHHVCGRSPGMDHLNVVVRTGRCGIYPPLRYPGGVRAFVKHQYAVRRATYRSTRGWWYARPHRRTPHSPFCTSWWTDFTATDSTPTTPGVRADISTEVHYHLPALPHLPNTDQVARWGRRCWTPGHLRFRAGATACVWTWDAV